MPAKGVLEHHEAQEVEELTSPTDTGRTVREQAALEGGEDALCIVAQPTEEVEVGISRRDESNMLGGRVAGSRCMWREQDRERTAPTGDLNRQQPRPTQ